MKSLLLSVFSLFLTAAIASTDPVVTGSSVDLSASTVSWTGKKLTGQHTGTIALKSAELVIGNGEITSGMFEIDMTSIKSTDLPDGKAQKLEGHLKSDDFFGITKFPTASLKITSSSKASEANMHNVVADLTIKGITHSIEFVTEVVGNKASAAITIDRSKFDVRYGSGSFFDGLGDKAIYDNFDLIIELVLD